MTANSQAEPDVRKATMPVRRDMRFKLPADRATDWHAMGEQVSIFMNTLSIFFPMGERFFIDSLRHYRDAGAIKDPELQEAVRAFIGQEAMHGREHDEFNAMVADAGLPVERLEARVERLLAFLQKTLPPSMQLSATCALEHWTAMMGGMLLAHPEVFDDCEPRYRDKWMWHAMEETEHKGVAFDVYRAVLGKGVKAEAIRSLGLVLATAIFWARVFEFHAEMMAAHNKRKAASGKRRKRSLRQRLRSAVELAQFTVGTQPGFLRVLAPEFLSYFRPGFHPWDKDNHHLLAGVKELEARYAA